MKKILFLIFSLYVGSLYSQSLELAAGVDINTFYQVGNNSYHYTSTYTMGPGFVVRGAYNISERHKIPIRLTIAYDKYQGDLSAQNSGLGGGYYLDAQIDKSVLMFGVSANVLKPTNNLNLSFGLDFSVLLAESVDGTERFWSQDSTWTRDMTESYKDYNSSSYFGLNATISYDFHITDEISIFPQYTFYLGLSKELTKFPDFTKSIRQYFCIGIKKKIVRKNN
jgi:hypothetical protein